MLRLRLCELLGCTLGELADRMTVDELPVWAAYGERYGPWWAERLDWIAARIVTAIVAAAGVTPGPLAEYLIEWGGGSAPAPNLLPYADGMLALAAMSGRAGPAT